MSRNIMATWYLHDDADASEYFPQAIAKSGTTEAAALYMRCVCVFFASARPGPNDELVFFTNRNDVPEPFRSILKRLRVRTVVIPNRVRPPRTEAAGSWSNQFYVFDILDHLASGETFDVIVVADSDCVWRTAPDELFDDARRYGALTLNLHEPRDLKVNGISRDMLRDVYRRVFSSPADAPVYYCGGEFLAATKAGATAIHDTFQSSRDRFFETFAQVGGGEEAHLLSLIYHKLGFPCGTGNQHIKRTWTTFKHDTVTPDDAVLSRTLLHLPSEKRTGFKQLFGNIDEYLSAAPGRRLEMENQVFGLPRRNKGKLLLDLAVLSSLKMMPKARRLPRTK